MELERFLNLLAATVGAIGSLYVMKSAAGLSAQLIERLSRSSWDFSSDQIDALTAQKAEALVGIPLVLTAFAIAVINLAFVPSDLQLPESGFVAVGAIAAVVVPIWAVLNFIAKVIRERDRTTVKLIVARRLLQEFLDLGRLLPIDVPGLGVCGVLLGMPAAGGESPRQHFERLAARVGLSIPLSFSFAKLEN